MCDNLPAELLECLKTDRTQSLGTSSQAKVAMRPMTAQADDENSSDGIYFFASRNGSEGLSYHRSPLVADGCDLLRAGPQRSKADPVEVAIR